MLEWPSVASVFSFLFTLVIAAGAIGIAVWASRKANTQSELISRLARKPHSAQSKTNRLR